MNVRQAYIVFICLVLFLSSCNKIDKGSLAEKNPELTFTIPVGFPALNPSFNLNKPTKYGVELGEKLFNDKKLSVDNSISCSSCHQQSNGYADHNQQAIGVYGRVSLRNAPPIQNLAFMKFYNWDGSKLSLEDQPLVPIITHEEMNSSIIEVISKIEKDAAYKKLFQQAFGDEKITAERIYKSLAQYEYTLISANSKYDHIQRKEAGVAYTESEKRGYQTFEKKCIMCHSTELFTDQSFRNVGFPINLDSNEAGRARITGNPSEYMSFRVPSLRNVEYTAPYGSFGQFSTLEEVLDYFDKGVIKAENLDPILKNNGNRIPLSKREKQDLLAFMKTLSDENFTKRN